MSKQSGPRKLFVYTDYGKRDHSRKYLRAVIIPAMTKYRDREIVQATTGINYWTPEFLNAFCGTLARLCEGTWEQLPRGWCNRSNRWLYTQLPVGEAKAWCQPL